jgi:hypothetical protein
MTAAAMLLVAIQHPAGAQDSTGVRIAPVPENLPPAERARLEKQHGLLKAAADSINAAIGRFNSRCGIKDPPASCFSEMAELQSGGSELENLKVRFNAAVKAAVAASAVATATVVAPVLAPAPANAERVATAGAKATKDDGAKIRAEATKEISTPEDDPCKGGKGSGGSAMAQLRAAAASGKAAAASGDKVRAMDVMDRCGKGVSASGETAVIGERKPLEVPEVLKTNPDFLALGKKEQELAAEHAKLKSELDAARARKEAGKGDPKTLSDAVYQAQKKMSENEQAQTNTRFKEEEMIRNVNRGVNFGGKSNKTPPPAPAGTKRNIL